MGGKLTFAGPLKVQVVINEISDMKIHVSNLLRGRQVMGNTIFYLNFTVYL